MWKAFRTRNWSLPSERCAPIEHGKKKEKIGQPGSRIEVVLLSRNLIPRRPSRYNFETRPSKDSLWRMGKRISFRMPSCSSSNILYLRAALSLSGVSSYCIVLMPCGWKTSLQKGNLWMQIPKTNALTVPPPHCPSLRINLVIRMYDWLPLIGVRIRRYLPLFIPRM